MAEYFNVKLVSKSGIAHDDVDAIRDLFKEVAAQCHFAYDDGDGVISIRHAYGDGLVIDDIVDAGYAYMFEDTKPMEAVPDEGTINFFWRIRNGQVERCGGIVVPDKQWVVGGEDNFQMAPGVVAYDADEPAVSPRSLLEMGIAAAQELQSQLPSVPTPLYHPVECECDLCTYDATLIEHPGEY